MDRIQRNQRGRGTGPCFGAAGSGEPLLSRDRRAGRDMESAALVTATGRGCGTRGTTPMPHGDPGWPWAWITLRPLSRNLTTAGQTSQEARGHEGHGCRSCGYRAGQTREEAGPRGASGGRPLGATGKKQQPVQTTLALLGGSSSGPPGKGPLCSPDPSSEKATYLCSKRPPVREGTHSRRFGRRAV